MSVQQAVAIIEQTIRDFGLDPDENRAESGYRWDLTRGSASIGINLFHIDEERIGLEISSRIMDLPEMPLSRLELLDEVMDLNARLVGGWFCAYDGGLLFIYKRGIEGLDSSELRSIIDNQSYYADKYDDELRERFG